MLRVKEVAAALGVHPSTVYRWIKGGQLDHIRHGNRPPEGPSMKRGGAIRVPESSVVALLPEALLNEPVGANA